MRPSRAFISLFRWGAFPLVRGFYSGPRVHTRLHMYGRRYFAYTSSVCVRAFAHLHARADPHAHRLTQNAFAHASCISSPRIRIYQPESLDEDLQLAAIEYLMANSPKNRLSRQNSGNGSHSLFSPTLSVRHSRSFTHSAATNSLSDSPSVSHILSLPLGLPHTLTSLSRVSMSLSLVH